jgi:hypothetical protein
MLHNWWKRFRKEDIDEHEIRQRLEYILEPYEAACSAIREICFRNLKR